MPKRPLSPYAPRHAKFVNQPFIRLLSKATRQKMIDDMNQDYDAYIKNVEKFYGPGKSKTSS